MSKLIVKLTSQTSKKYLRVIILSSMFVSLAAGCQTTDEKLPLVDDRPALPFPASIELESVCGAVDDLQHVELYNGNLGISKAYVAEHQSSTIQLQWKPKEEINQMLGNNADAGNIASVRWCSGTLFQKKNVDGNAVDYVLTAAHCLEAIADGWYTPTVNGQTLSPGMNARMMDVNFNYQINGETGSMRVESKYHVRSLVEFGYPGLDYAILELGNIKSGDESYPKRYAETSARPLQTNESLTIIQHPNGDPKKVESGQLLLIRQALAYYSNIDTHSGASGAAVRDSKGNIVALHTNGGCTKVGGANKGVLLEAISNVSSIL